MHDASVLLAGVPGCDDAQARLDSSSVPSLRRRTSGDELDPCVYPVQGNFAI